MSMPRIVASIAVLQGINSFGKGQYAFVGATNDFFKFDEASSATHDGVDVVKPTSLLTRKPGRWLRVSFSTEDISASANAKSLIAAANYAAMRALLDLEPGTDFYSKSAADSAFQAASAALSSLAGASANGISLVTAANYAAMKGLLDLEIGTDLQAYDADLAAIAALSTTTFGRSLLELANAAALAAASGLGVALTTAPSTIPSIDSFAGVAPTFLRHHVRWYPDPGDKTTIVKVGTATDLARGGNNYTDGSDGSNTYIRIKNTNGSLTGADTGGTVVTKGSEKPHLFVMIKTGTVLPAAADEAFFLGFTDASDPYAFPYPKVGNYVGFIFEYEDLGANWQAFTSDAVDATAAHRTKVDTGVPFVASSRHVFQIARTTTGWAFWIDGVRVAHITSAGNHVPADSTGLKFHIFSLADDGGSHNGFVDFAGAALETD